MLACRVAVYIVLSRFVFFFFFCFFCFLFLVFVWFSFCVRLSRRVVDES